MTRIVA